jgi:hypothetical protein
MGGMQRSIVLLCDLGAGLTELLSDTAGYFEEHEQELEDSERLLLSLFCLL